MTNEEIKDYMEEIEQAEVEKYEKVEKNWVNLIDSIQILNAYDKRFIPLMEKMIRIMEVLRRIKKFHLWAWFPHTSKGYLDEKEYQLVSNGNEGQVIYYTRDGDVLCGKCADKLLHDIDDLTEWGFGKDEGLDIDAIVACDTYLEGPDLYCEDCNEVIESSYGDPYAEEVDESQESEEVQ